MTIWELIALAKAGDGGTKSMLRFKGSVLTESALPESGNDGDTYLVDSADSYFAWDGEGWTDVGQLLSMDDVAALFDQVEDAGDQQVARIVAKGQEVEKSIPEDYSELSGDVDNVKSALDDIGVVRPEGTVALTTTWGKQIESDGSIVTRAGNYGVSKGLVNPGITYYITGSSHFTKPFFAWYASDDTLVQIGTLSPAGSTVTSITGEPAIAPVGAAYIIINQISSGSLASATYVEGYSLPALEQAEEDIDDLVEGESNIITALGGYVDDIEPVSLVSTYGKYIKGNGAIVDAANNYAIDVGSVIPGDKYYITASTNFSNPFYCWYNNEDTLVQIGTLSDPGSTYSSISDVEVTAPTGATKIVINWNSASIAGALKHLSGKRFPKIWKGKKWACVGDSLTDNNQYTTKHYFDFVADATDITPINMGDSGTGYKRGYDSDRAFYQRILAIDTTVDVVTIFGSFNDIGAGYDLGTYTDTGTTTIAGCINTTIDNLQALMPTVILGIVAPTPWATARPDFHTSADNYVNMLKKIAEHRSIPYLDLFRCSNLRPWDEDFRELCYSKDISGGVLSGVHPNELGHKILAPKFEAFLDSLLLH